MHPVIHYLSEILPKRPGFQRNPVQIAYAEALVDGLKEQGKLHFVEGDTGIGKSLAYQLVLADWVAKGKHMGGKQAARRALISTHSRALQRQLLQPDNLAIVRDYLHHAQLPLLSFALRMGRENYLNPERLALNLGVVSLESAAEDSHLPAAHRRLARWALKSDGCLLDLDPAWLPEGWQLRDIALRPTDPLPESLETQHQAAQQSDILVINHALLAVDLVTQGKITQAEAPYALLLDEAEHYPEIAEELLSERISLQSATHLLKQLKQHRVVKQWQSLLDNMTERERAGSAHSLTPYQSEAMQAAVTALLKLRPRESSHDPALWREWQHLRQGAEKIAARLREASRYLVLDYSPVLGLPGIVAHAPSAASSLKAGAKERVTFMTSATLSDLDHAPGEIPNFRYMRSRLQLPVTHKRSGLQRSFQAQRFGTLRFRLPRALPHPLSPQENGDYRLANHFCQQALPYITDQLGRTLVLCASYADVAALEAAWPLEQVHRLVAHHPGMGLSEVVAKLEKDAILLTPAGWEGLSPSREDNQAYWQHLVVVRNPRPMLSQVEQHLVEQLLHRRDVPEEDAKRIANGMLQRKNTVRTLHKLRQGLGRAIRHPDDDVLVTLLEPRIPRPSGYPPREGVYVRQTLLGAIPARFMRAYQSAEEPGGKETEGTTPNQALAALL
ncbi:helicase C-terminal domain-containing protein [Halomonas vilamensis]|uniref:Helicase C-terminal domain-containing protein n=1 Tax=Vreelandella vilamensis TaxID=531309 RepID=A0ABU1H593_9GAMM|nr:helicase C-terminal domain-containing protein [Halomonas vilamensis]MDR5899476.1 helicase C-terminal domain-containing protein [Halomonas vilamensis]